MRSLATLFIFTQVSNFESLSQTKPASYKLLTPRRERIYIKIHWFREGRAAAELDQADPSLQVQKYGLNDVVARLSCDLPDAAQPAQA